LPAGVPPFALPTLRERGRLRFRRGMAGFGACALCLWLSGWVGGGPGQQQREEEEWRCRESCLLLDEFVKRLDYPTTATTTTG